MSCVTYKNSPSWQARISKHAFFLCVVHASGGTVGADSFEIGCELSRTTLDGVT